MIQKVPQVVLVVGMAFSGCDFQVQPQWQVAGHGIAFQPVVELHGRSPVGADPTPMLGLLVRPILQTGHCLAHPVGIRIQGIQGIPGHHLGWPPAVQGQLFDQVS